jgi:DNA repair exonuclease SbcCD ATPase subunit
MEKVTDFTILRLSLTGFKCFEQKAVFDFGKTAHITAANGKGKSSIADAIAYAFTGTPFFGGNGLDRLQNRNARKLEVSVEFVDGTGTTHILTRIRKGNLTTILYDGFDVRQKDISAIFGEKEVFLSILNPLYFIDSLGDSDKGLLEKLLPVVRHEDVLASLSERSRKLLQGESLLSPETYIRTRRTEIRGLEEALIRYTGQKELLDHQREKRDSQLAELETAREEAQDEIARLVVLRDESRNLDVELSALHRERECISEAIQSIADNCECPICLTVMTFAEANEVISGLKQRLSDLDSRITALDNHSGNGLSPTQADRLACLENAVREFGAKIEVFNNLPADDDYSDLILETEVEINRLKTLVSEAVQYAGVRAELMLSHLKMNRAEIVLTEVVRSTGEVKDCFRFSYEGRDYRCLSLSEKIKAGLEVSDLIKRLSSRNYPVFIDNAESICSIDNIKPFGQVICARVVRGEDLNVSFKNDR